MIMKKGILLTSIILALLTTSCVKHSCEYGQPAKIVFLKEPYKAQCWINKKYYKINAHVFMDSQGSYTFKITGPVPKEFQTGDTINARLLLKEVPYYEAELCYVYIPGPDDDPNGAQSFYNLYCIEKE